jgi:glycosyltransferase involved in cell wall biosynthesis
MKISAIIPAYNSEGTIARALNSVLAQTRPADEIIVIDDGSTDKTAQAAGAFGGRVRLIQQANAGVSAARNAGIHAASGDWIAFLDADDEWLPEKLRLQTEHLRRHPDLKWTFTDLLWDRKKVGHLYSSHPKNDKIDQSPRDEVFEDYFQAYARSYFLSTITVLIEKTVFQSVGLFESDFRFAEDNDLWFRIAYQYPMIGYLSDSLSIYHLDTINSLTKINDRIETMIYLVHRHETLSRKLNRYNAFRPCITHMLQTWIRQLISQKRYADAKCLLNSFPGYCSGRFQREMRFRLFWPPVMNPVADSVMQLKKKK